MSDPRVCRPTLAAVATIPGRPIDVMLASIRPQVDRLHVVCNRMAEPPSVVRELADEWVCDHEDPSGSIAKLRWAQDWDGLYFGCDDDLRYPGDYVEVMRTWIDRWDARAIATCHGRILNVHATRWQDAGFTAHALRDVKGGRWLNYPGGCAMAFDTRLNVPGLFPGRNTEEAHLAVWSQRHRVPIWLVPHTAAWLGYLLPLGKMEADPNRPGYTIYAEEVATHFANRNSVLRQWAHGWGVHELG